ncbi:MAG TPA: hypothetical protein ENI45_02085, partial [Thermoplasmatales archaeon]|nr:hypothetical protein [Thermoplasmatales archaeon]
MKMIGVYTKNFSLYHDIIDAINDRGLEFVVLPKPDRVPSRVGVVITSSLEKGNIACKHVVAADNFRTVNNALDKALQILRGKERYKEIIIGVDPGEYPGVALLGDGEVIQTWCVSSPSAAVTLVEQIVHGYDADKKIIR